MYMAFLLVVLGGQLGSPTVMAVGDRVPVIDVEKTCKETTEVDKATNLALSQSFEKCMSDENSAKEQVAAVWLTYPGPVRVHCEQEATLVGIGSYVDLLTCMQMSDPSKLTPTMDLRGASKDRNRN
jgi:hypothetical protein